MPAFRASYYGLTTQTPFEVWIALDRAARSPRIDEPKLRVVRFSGAAMKSGIEVKAIEGVPVRIYGVAKTVADCFKYRSKMSTDVAIEALREAWRGKRCTMDEFWRFAKICRVANVMRPISSNSCRHPWQAFASLLIRARSNVLRWSF